jgi:hypothetical protein
MSHKLNSAIAVIGIDIGKNAFHLVGLDKRGAIVLRQKWSRGQVKAPLANLSPCLIGMEAFVGAHHLSRKLHVGAVRSGGRRGRAIVQRNCCDAVMSLVGQNRLLPHRNSRVRFSSISGHNQMP